MERTISRSLHRKSQGKKKLSLKAKPTFCFIPRAKTILKETRAEMAFRPVRLEWLVGSTLEMPVLPGGVDIWMKAEFNLNRLLITSHWRNVFNGIKKKVERLCIKRSVMAMNFVKRGRQRNWESWFLDEPENHTNKRELISKAGLNDVPKEKYGSSSWKNKTTL